METPKATDEEIYRKFLLTNAVNERTKRLENFRVILSCHLQHDKDSYGFDEFVADVIEMQMVLWSKNEDEKNCTLYYIPLDRQVTVDYATYYQLDLPRDYTRNSIDSFERDFLHICFEAELYQINPDSDSNRYNLPDDFATAVHNILHFRYNHRDDSPDKENTDPNDGFVLK